MQQTIQFYTQHIPKSHIINHCVADSSMQPQLNCGDWVVALNDTNTLKTMSPPYIAMVFVANLGLMLRNVHTSNTPDHVHLTTNNTIVSGQRCYYDVKPTWIAPVVWVFNTDNTNGISDS